MRDAFSGRDDIHAEPKAVYEVHVGMTGGAEHDFSAFGTPAGRMGSQVFGPHVCLGLNDPTDSLGYSVIVDEM